MPITSPSMICIVSDGRYHGRRIACLLEMFCNMFAKNHPQITQIHADMMFICFTKVFLNLWKSAKSVDNNSVHVPDASRLHLMRTSTCVVAVAESLHVMSQTSLRDCRSCRGRPCART